MRISIGVREAVLPVVLAMGVLCVVSNTLGCPPLPPVVTISATDAIAAETGPDPGTFTVTRTGGDQSGALTVYYTYRLVGSRLRSAQFCCWARRCCFVWRDYCIGKATL